MINLTKNNLSLSVFICLFLGCDSNDDGFNRTDYTPKKLYHRALKEASEVHSSFRLISIQSGLLIDTMGIPLEADFWAFNFGRTLSGSLVQSMLLGITIDGDVDFLISEKTDPSFASRIAITDTAWLDIPAAMKIAQDAGGRAFYNSHSQTIISCYLQHVGSGELLWYISYQESTESFGVFINAVTGETE
jgi:hypothetical protein